MGRRGRRHRRQCRNAINTLAGQAPALPLGEGGKGHGNIKEGCSFSWIIIARGGVIGGFWPELTFCSQFYLTGARSSHDTCACLMHLQ